LSWTQYRVLTKSFSPMTYKALPCEGTEGWAQKTCPDHVLYISIYRYIDFPPAPHIAVVTGWQSEPPGYINSSQTSSNSKKSCLGYIGNSGAHGFQKVCFRMLATHAWVQGWCLHVKSSSLQYTNNHLIALGMILRGWIYKHTTI